MMNQVNYQILYIISLREESKFHAAKKVRRKIHFFA